MQLAVFVSWDEANLPHPILEKLVRSRLDDTMIRNFGIDWYQDGLRLERLYKYDNVEGGFHERYEIIESTTK